MKESVSSNQVKVAYQILQGFEKSYRWFSRITGEAQSRFEQAQWLATQMAIKERIAIYEQSVSDVVAEIYQQIHPHQLESAFWKQLKHEYMSILDQHPQFELAETFYNSIIGRIFKHQKIDDDWMFMLPSRCFIAGLKRDKVVNSFSTTVTVRQMLDEIFDTYRFNIPFVNKEADLQKPG